MKALRTALQVGAFLFFAAYFLLLVTGTPLRIPTVPSPSHCAPPPDVAPKPSPIEMLRAVGPRQTPPTSGYERLSP